ncbi:hypothetical protein Taro_048365 [Colocasia esculenta]|uniref:Dof-type domain-containing protein n=1 Tax=Colocasia esculenta TaxID=4460 RepID=A0A843X555_COLES|nr:hypothetical protein [Colocasia esculenta]
MAECKGLVKLFGKTIPVPAEGAVAVGFAEEAGGGGGGGGGGGEEGSKCLPDRSRDAAEAQQKDQESSSSQEQGDQQVSSPTGSENDKGSPPTVDQEPPPEKNSKVAEDQDTASNPQEKTIKKPDKILPCPRCNSMDTKFCYYNNYNVNQPRHFCKNCQRYWTAGGTMRNVPVGAGRRKNKHSASHYRHIAVAKAALQPCRPDITELVHHTELKPNGTVLTFASDMPLCDSMASVLNLVEKHVLPFSCTSGGAEAADEHSSGSSVTASNSAADGGGFNGHDPAASQNCQAYPPPVSCYRGAPWPYPWPAALPMCASSFPIPVYPMTPYWGCTVPGAWSVPWLAPLSSSPPSGGSAGTGPNSPTLGKHSRDGDALRQGISDKGDAPEKANEERCLWIPKTLRINDPEEAAKSSIWATMGFKNDKTDGVSRGGLFRDLNQPKAEINNRTVEPSSQVLHANPAALSRSLTFHESS